MKFTYYGHACFAVQAGGKTLLFDPFISPNPLAKNEGGPWINPPAVTPAVPAALLGLGTPIAIRADGSGPASGQPSADGKPGSRSSKTDDHRPSISVPHVSRASADASGGAAASAAGVSGGGVGLGVEFVLPLLAMVSWALALALRIPHSSAFALRSERPG